MLDEHRSRKHTEAAADAEHGGDPACWLAFLCPECGRFAEQGLPARCEHCGTDLPAD
ncbi:hypothetical protein [Bounagaea algeriensis]